MAIRTELTLRLPNSPGALARLCSTLSEARVNVLALHLESSGRLRIVVDNPLQAVDVLKEHQHQTEQREVLYALIANLPGALSDTARLLAEGDINVEYAYAAAVEGAPMAAVVFGVGDAQRAAAAAGM